MLIQNSIPDSSSSTNGKPLRQASIFYVYDNKDRIDFFKNEFRGIIGNNVNSCEQFLFYTFKI